jgi:HB1, ASXL, restriction endonuclease HTH domain
MKFLEAAKVILQQNSNKPMSAKEITTEILNQKLCKTKGKTPWASLNTMMLAHSVNSSLSDKSLKSHNSKNIQLFEMVGNLPVKFILTNNTLFNKIEIEDNDEVETESIIKDENKILLHTICAFDFNQNKEILNWDKRISVYNIDNKIECIIEKQENITYFFLDPANSQVKIGKASDTNDPLKRLNQFKTSNPRLEIIYACPFELYTEKGENQSLLYPFTAHEIFDEIKVHPNREFFYYAKKLENLISDLRLKHEEMLKLYNLQLTKEEQENHLLRLFS